MSAFPCGSGRFQTTDACHWQELQKIYEPLAMADLSSELESILKGLVAKVNSRDLNY